APATERLKSKPCVQFPVCITAKRTMANTPIDKTTIESGSRAEWASSAPDRKTESGDTPRIPSNGSNEKMAVTMNPVTNPSKTAAYDTLKSTSTGRKSPITHGNTSWIAIPNATPTSVPTNPKNMVWIRNMDSDCQADSPRQRRMATVPSFRRV